MSIDLSQFHAAFFEEALESLDQAEECLLSLAKQASQGNCIDAAFRAIHSIKGSAGTLGFEQIASFSHGLEAVLETLRSLSAGKGFSILDQHTSLLLSTLDLLRAMVGNAQQKQGEIAPSRVNALSQKLKTIQDALDQQAKLPSSSTYTGLPETSKPPPASQTLIVSFRPNPGMLGSGNDPLRYLDALAANGALKTTALWNEQDALAWLASSKENKVQPHFLHWSIELETNQTPAQIRKLFEWIEDLCELDIAVQKPTQDLLSESLGEEGIDAQQDNLDQSLDLQDQAISEKNNLEPLERRREQRAIQVPTAKIDSLLGHLADLATFQSELEGKVVDQEINELFNRLGRQTRQLQSAILAMRMSPIATLFKRFERVVRDAELELGKQVRVVIEGENNELDSSIIERLIDPVTHLIRNALDHGIEPTSERTQLGKDALATLSLHAEQQGSSFVLTVKDDGRGFDIPAIRASAIRKGLAEDQSVRSDSQWAEMIFAPGFSTAAKVNQWSGRGVGLDAVAEAIKSLNGQLLVHSTAGQGTSFSIVLPLTLALTDALIVESHGERYALALGTIGECLQITHTDLQALSNGQQLYPLRNQLLPYANLGNLMGSQTGATNNSPSSNDADSRLLGIVLKTGDEACLLGVSKIIGERQIVIKNIENNLGAARYCQSATILGEGRVVFVLDSTALREAIGSLQLTTM